jgi:hypothetical protein
MANEMEKDMQPFQEEGHAGRRANTLKRISPSR